MLSPDRKSYRTSSYWSAAEARDALSDQQASGLSVIQFAEREGLQAQRLYVWRRRLAYEKFKASSASQFIELRPAHSVSHTIEVMLLSGLVVKATTDIEPDTLARFVSAIERSSGC
jgi:hypothetical protein